MSAPGSPSQPPVSRRSPPVVARVVPRVVVAAVGAIVLVATLAGCAGRGDGDVDGAAPTSDPPGTAPAHPPAHPSDAVAVVGVVDGDTIDVDGDERVRLIGIDTPEIGQCGYGEATAALRALVGGRDVVLVPGATQDRDRYGRLLRYVEVDGVDVNLQMVRSGRAIARYDSRDGYGRHPREDEYVAADAASPTANRCSPAGGASTTAAPPAGGTAASDPRFGSCAAAIAAGYGPYVRGVDPEYDWYDDGDDDGVNCE